MPGHTATQNADGTWNVSDVPIFGPLPAGARKNKQPIGREWMEAAVAKSKLRAAENYHAPAHLRHTGDDQPKIPMGGFVARRVGPYTYEGKSIDAVFADLVNVPPGAYELLKRGELRFRSVEVFDWDVPEINELAFLETDTPFFRFGWDGIGREIPKAERIVTQDATLRPAMAFAAAGKGGIALFAFDDESEDDDADDKPKQSCKGAAHMGAHCGGCDEYTKGATNMPVDDKDVKNGAEMKALSDELAALRAGNTDLKTQLDAEKTERAKDIARLAALEQKDQEREKASLVERLVGKARTALKDHGFNFSAKVEEHFKKLAAGPEGEKEVDAFTTLCKEQMRQDPPSSFAAANGRAATDVDGAEITKCVAKFSANGADPVRVQEAARKSAAQFREHEAAARARHETVMPLERWLDIQMPELLGAGS